MIMIQYLVEVKNKNMTRVPSDWMRVSRLVVLFTDPCILVYACVIVCIRNVHCTCTCNSESFSVKLFRSQIWKPGWKGTHRCMVLGGYCVFWRYTLHYTRLTTKFLAGHTQACTSAHERTDTSGPKINSNGVLTVH